MMPSQTPKDTRSSAGAAFSQHHRNNGGFQPGKFQQVPGNGLALSPFLRRHAAESAGGVDKADHRPVELLRLLGQPQGFAVALRVGGGKIGFLVFLQIPPLYLADDCHRDAV